LINRVHAQFESSRYKEIDDIFEKKKNT